MTIISDVDLILNELNMKPKGASISNKQTTIADRIEILEKNFEKIRLVMGDIEQRSAPLVYMGVDMAKDGSDRPVITLC
jgi:hypothetical protein